MSNSPDSSREGWLSRIIDAGLVLILVTAPTQYSFEVAEKVYLSIVDPLIWGVCALWGIHLLRSHSISQIRLPPLYLVLFIAMGVLSVMRSVQVMASLKDLFQLIEYFIAGYLLFFHHLDRPERLRRFVAIFLAVGAVIVFVGLVQYTAGQVEDFRVRGTFGNRNVLGGFLSLTLPLFFGLMMHETNKWKRAFFLTVIVFGLGITLSGGSFLAIALAIIVLALMRHITAFVTCCVVLCAGIVFLLPGLPRANHDVLFESIALYPDGHEVGNRYTEWQAAVVMTEENPLLGVGIGNYQANIGQYYGSLPSPAVKLEDDSQNMYLVVASTMGLPGLALLLAVLVSHAWSALALYWRSTDDGQRGLSLGLLGSILAFSLNCIWSPLLVRGIGVPLAFIFVLIAVLGSVPTTDPEKPA
jgi:O-antigen ligase